MAGGTGCAGMRTGKGEAGFRMIEQCAGPRRCTVTNRTVCGKGGGLVIWIAGLVIGPNMA